MSSSTEEAVAVVAGFLDEQAVPYMVIGAMATLVWGSVRTTRDVDFKVNAGDGRALLRACLSRFRLRTAEPDPFLAATHVIPVIVNLKSGPISADLVLAGMPYEFSAIERARNIEIGARAVKVCTAEDLIIHKIISERARDLDDVRGIILRQGPSLDRQYLEPKIKELSEAFARPEIWQLYENCRNRALGQADQR